MGRQQDRMTTDALGELTEESAQPEPLEQFRLWYSWAAEQLGIEADVMALATATPDGRPSARYVLLKGCDERGFVFYTGYRSRKAAELEVNPRAAAVLQWGLEPRRQVRVEGVVSRLPEAESDAYFRTRPLDSQLGTWASPQSEVIPDRAYLEARLADAGAHVRGGEVPRPDDWGGYVLQPEVFEFWQSRSHRLHDRLRYTRTPDGEWRRERLAP